MRSIHLPALLAILAALFLAVCSRQPPISTTLTDLIAESNDYSVDPLISFHENLSINGLLLQPQVGTHWYTAHPGFLERWKGETRSSPAFAIGISARLEEPSFCLSGETLDPPDITAVNEVKKHIEEVQAHTVEAIRATTGIAVKQAALQRVAIDKISSAAEKKATQDALDKEIADLQKQKLDADKAIADALGKYRDLVASKPGLIVARWTVSDSSGAAARTSIFDTSYSQAKTTTGYLVLGGVRVSSLYFGDDFRAYVGSIGKNEQAFFDRMGITTYLIQTKALAYTNALDLQRAFSGSLSARSEERRVGK